MAVVIQTMPVRWQVELLDRLTEHGSEYTAVHVHAEYWIGRIKWVSLPDPHCLDKGLILETEKNILNEGIRHSLTALHPARRRLANIDSDPNTAI